MWFHLFFFYFLTCALCTISKNHCQEPCQKAFFLLFLLEILWFLVLHLSFHFVLIFVSDIRQGSSFISYLWISSFPRSIYLRDCLFSTDCFLLHCQILVHPLCVGLISRLLVLFHYSTSVFKLVWDYFNYHSFIIQLEIKNHDDLHYYSMIFQHTSIITMFYVNDPPVS